MKTVMIGALCALLQGVGMAATAVPLNDPKISYDGAWYREVSADRAVLDRISPEAYGNPESGYGEAWYLGLVHTQTGIRVRFATASISVSLTFAKRADGYDLDGAPNPTNGFTVFADNEEIATFSTLTFSFSKPAGKIGAVVYEVTLPNLWSVDFTGLSLDDGALLEECPALSQPVYVAIGDSKTHGTGQYVSTAKTWPFQLSKLLGWDLHNVAVAGGLTGWATALNLKGKQVDVVTIELGFNDWKYLSDPAATVAAKYGRLIDSARAYAPLAKIHCITPLATTETSFAGPYTIADLRAALVQQISSRQQSGDTRLFCIDGPSISDETMLASGDPVHLSEYGATKLAERLAAIIDTGMLIDTLPDTANASIDKVEDVDAWEALADDLGSTVDSVTKTGAEVRTVFTQIAQPSSDVYPWTSLSCLFDSPLTGMTGIKVSWMSNEQVIVSLPQPPLDTSGSSYSFTLPASDTMRTMVIAKKDFAQPSWRPRAALDLSNVESIAFSPVAPDPTKITHPSLSIGSLVTYGVGNVGVSSSASVKTVGRLTPRLSGGILSCQFSTPGTYRLDLLDLAGRTIVRSSIAISNPGVQSIELGGIRRGAGCLLLRVSGPAGTAVSRIISAE